MASLLASHEKALSFLLSQQKKDGSYEHAEQDISCYYKHPFLFAVAGKTEEANRMLDFIKSTMFQKSGDFISSTEKKSNNPDLAHYHCYTNAWLVMAAQKLGRFDISYPGYAFIKSFIHPSLGGFVTNAPYGKGNDSLDLITNAHLGLTALFMGDVPTAEGVGKVLIQFLEKQENSDIFYIRTDKQGQLVKDFDASLDQRAARSCYQVVKKEEFQLYFMMGYPAAFLVHLYRATSKEEYLTAAKKYTDYTLSCDESATRSHWSHKAAWGASEIAAITGEKHYADYARKVADHLVNTQDKEGSWKKSDGILQQYDQTAEVGIWLKVIEALTHKFYS